MGATQQILMAYGAAPFVGPLDAYEGISTGVWSLVRRLLTSYTGNLIRIRRTSDSVEQDFGPLANGRLDVAGVLTFLGGGSGVVTTVYDQITSNNWTQSSGAMQPAWVEGLSEFNDAPAMYLGNVEGMVNTLSVAKPYSLLLTECNPDAASIGSGRTLSDSIHNFLISSGRGGLQCFVEGVVAAVAGANSSAVVEVLTAPSSGDYTFYSNAADITTGSVTTIDLGELRLGKNAAVSEAANSNVAEMVAFNTDLSGAQVTALQAIFNPATL